MARLGEFLVHHWALALAFLLILGLLMATEMKRRVLGFKDVPTDEAIRLINRDNAVVIDVREDKDYRDGHIINAVHIPLGLLDARVNQLEKHKDKPIIVCCKSGQESARAGVTCANTASNRYTNSAAAWRRGRAPICPWKNRTPSGRAGAPAHP